MFPNSVRGINSLKRRLLLTIVAVMVVMLPVAGYLEKRGLGIVPIACASTKPPVYQGAPRIYTTTFGLTENPISERGNWISGKGDGLNWADVQTTPGLAFGTESGTNGYDDSTALLTGNWGPDQTAEATVHSVNQNDNVYEEVELRLRSSLSAHRNTGYEINFRCSKSKDAYTQIVRWNGPLGKFTYIANKQGSEYGVANGDVVKATMTGSVINVYINGRLVLQGTDKTYKSGSPGMGFYLQGGTGVNSDYGFSRFSAYDGQVNSPSPLSGN